MSKYVSFAVVADCWRGQERVRLFAGTSLASHDGIEAGWGIAPGGLRESEWTADDDGLSLAVRVEDAEDTNAYRAAILSDYPTRRDLLHAITEGRAPRGTKVWWRDGKLHRDDGPAYVGADGSKEWWRDDKRHRDDGPACEYVDGTKEWWRDGKRHRDDGPAYVGANGTKEWWRDGCWEFPNVQ